MTELTRDMDVLLTHEEKTERSRMLAERVQDVASTKEAAKEVMKGWKDKIKLYEGEVQTLATAVRTGRERRPVRCLEQVDDRLMKVNIVRLDTMAVVEQRALTSDEMEEMRQPELFGDDARRTSDSNNLSPIPEFETTRGPELSLPCPGPKGASGCSGKECLRCAGIGRIPPNDTVEVTEAVALDSPDLDESEAANDHDDGTEIDDPASVLGGD